MARHGQEHRLDPRLIVMPQQDLKEITDLLDRHQALLDHLEIMEEPPDPQ
jgi:hypothetical protein